MSQARSASRDQGRVFEYRIILLEYWSYGSLLTLVRPWNSKIAGITFYCWIFASRHLRAQRHQHSNLCLLIHRHSYNGMLDQLLNKPQQLTRNVRTAACAQIFRNLHDEAICYRLDHVSLGIENMRSSRGNFLSRRHGYVYGKGSETIDWLFRLSGIERRA